MKAKVSSDEVDSRGHGAPTVGRRGLRLKPENPSDRCNARPTWAGIMLIECLVYLALFAAIFTLALGAFYRAFDQNTHLRNNAADIARTVRAGEHWRNDIRQATGDVELRPSADGTELHIPQAPGEVVYAFRQGSVWRRSTATPPEKEFLAGVKTSAMMADRTSRVTAWRWELELQNDQKIARVKPLFSFLAVPETKAER